MSSQIISKSLYGNSKNNINNIIEYKNNRMKKQDNNNVKISTINIDSRHRVSESKNVLGSDIVYLE